MAAVLLLALSLSVGCGEEKLSSPEEYIAVYMENPQTEPDSSDAGGADETQVYNYIDNILFTGGSGCLRLSEEEFVPEERVFSESSVNVTELFAEGSDTAERISALGLPYIYLWQDSADVLASVDPDEYAENVVGSAVMLREKCPDSMVIVLSVLPAAQQISGADKVADFNSRLKGAVKSCPDKYLVLMDIFSPLSENGFIKDIYDMGDGVTLSRSGLRKLIEVIGDERFYNDLSGDGKYRYLYKDIYAERPDYTPTEGKIAYLTFDDGPSKYTPEILEILRNNNIKATFFITGWCIDGKEDTLRQIAEEGHTVGLHSWSHEYDEIYASPEAWMDDFAKVYNKVYDVTGKKPWAFRFPGGSYNNFNKETAETIIGEMKRRGFAYYDWNCATSDATTSATYESCIENLKDSIYSDHSVVLMHDSLKLTPEYLQDVIDIFTAEGYSFENIDAADEVQF